MGLIWRQRVSADYHALVRALMPGGAIWTYGGTADTDAVLGAFADELARIDERGDQVALEFSPATAVETIDEWEDLLGLPDPADPSPPTVLADRQAAAHAALIARGGQTAAYYIGVSAALGVTVTIQIRPYGDPFVCGVSVCGDPLNSRGASFVWRVVGPAATDAALQDRLEALIERLSPAHTLVEFYWT